MSNYLQEKINNSFSYIPLRATSPYSLLQGAVTMDKISQNCLDYNIPAVAIVDNNNLFGALEFCEHMSHKGIQPIIGCNLNIIAYYSNHYDTTFNDNLFINIIVNE